MVKRAIWGALVMTGLVVTAAHAAPVSCAIAGQYDGKYDGADDHGYVQVAVAADGTLTGQAQSQITGGTFAIGGVVNGDGTLSTSGAVATGAQFGGRFFGDKAGGMWNKVVVANGSQHLIGGIWGVQKAAAAEGCQ
ncbi:hypothetical protein [Paraburkholderia sp. MM6662-R1]|uniref:hypothetical protein n=1 Tax=Paraburkholderia sp. MM6662-R1 TaxID=2991066 RepID=UPI003D1F89F5